MRTSWIIFDQANWRRVILETDAHSLRPLSQLVPGGLQFQSYIKNNVFHKVRLNIQFGQFGYSSVVFYVENEPKIGTSKTGFRAFATHNHHEFTAGESGNSVFIGGWAAPPVSFYEYKKFIISTVHVFSLNFLNWKNAKRKWTGWNETVGMTRRKITFIIQF